MRLTLPKWFDMHVHLRQEELLPITVSAQLSTHCAGIVAMPNTKPPVGKVFQKDALPYWSIETYQQMIIAHAQPHFEHIIIPLYLTKESSPEMIAQGAQAGLLTACKYYPPHGTTNAEHGRPLDFYHRNGVLAAMQDHGVILCLHGEAHNTSPQNYFDQKQNAEHDFYQKQLPNLVKLYPKLKIVCEHITTKTAVNFVETADAHVAATITPQHLLYTIGDLLQGLKYHLYCLPLLKFEQDRESLRQAIANNTQGKFFAGTDSAPHTQKATECGCAAGCYTAPIAPQLYAQAFESAGIDLSQEAGSSLLQQFLSENGPHFYQLSNSNETFTLVKATQKVNATPTSQGTLTPLPVGLGQTEIPWQLA